MQRDGCHKSPRSDTTDHVDDHVDDYPYLTHRYVLHPPELWETSEKKVSVWWFPVDYTQTHINGRYEANGKKGSNACTIICILTAIRIHEDAIALHSLPGFPLDNRFVSVYAECIGEGNAIHERLLRSGELTHMNLTVPEALTACGRRSSGFLEWFYVQKSLPNIASLPQSLFEQIHRAIREWMCRPPLKSCPDLYLILIADARSVLIIYQKSTGKLTLVDSHSHLHSGAVVAQTSLGHAKDLCTWYGNVCSKIFGTSPDCYELSLLYFKKASPCSRPRIVGKDRGDLCGD